MRYCSNDVHICDSSGNSVTLEYKTKASAGFDIRASEDVIVHPNETVLVSTGLFIESKSEQHVLILSMRSGKALKNNLILMNGMGIIDMDYRNEIKGIVRNLGNEIQEIKKGERFMQGLLMNVERPYRNNIVEPEERQGGFGSTGDK